MLLKHQFKNKLMMTQWCE